MRTERCNLCHTVVAFVFEHLRRKKESNSKILVDRISSLPDELLINILNFLPIKYAVTSSILTKRWRYLYKEVTHLDIDDSFLSKNAVVVNLTNSYVALIKMLDCAKLSNLIRFRINFNQCLYLEVGRWLKVMSHHRIQEIDLCIGTPLRFPDSMFTCKTLRILQLTDGFAVLTIPDTVCLPCLEILHLKKFRILNANVISRILSGCPLLQELVLTPLNWYEPDQLSISAPSLTKLILGKGCLPCQPRALVAVVAPLLQFFHYEDTLAESYFIKTSNYLVEAHLHIYIVFADVEDLARVSHSARVLVQGVSTVKRLFLSADCIQALTLVQDELPILRNLTKLKIGCSKNPHFTLLRLLGSAPNLEELIFSEGLFPVGFTDKDTAQQDYWGRDQVVPSCLKTRLKVVEIEHFLGLKEELRIVEYFLRNSHVIEQLHIHKWMGITGEVKVRKQLKRWQDLWTGLPNIDFDDRQVYCRSMNLSEKPVSFFDHAPFNNFVERVLIHRDITFITRFRLSCRVWCETETRVSSWISSAIRRDVKELELFLELQSPFHLPRCVFNCSSLGTLKICMECTLKLPKNVFLPNLKTLFLGAVGFSDEESINKLFSGCPCLEELKLIDCSWGKLESIAISSPTLKKLRIDELFYMLSVNKRNDCIIRLDLPNLVSFEFLGGLFNGIVLENQLSQLTNATVFILERPWGKFYTTLPPDVFNLFTRLKHATVLRVSSSTIKTLSVAEGFLGQLPSFQKLTRLELNVCIQDVSPDVLLKFVVGFPSLEILVLHEGAVSDQLHLHHDVCSTISQPSCHLPKLKMINLCYFHGGSVGEMYVLKNLVDLAPALQKVSIFCCSKMGLSEKDEIARMVQMLLDVCKGNFTVLFSRECSMSEPRFSRGTPISDQGLGVILEREAVLIRTLIRSKYTIMNGQEFKVGVFGLFNNLSAALMTLEHDDESTMDLALKEAAKMGDVKFLKEAFSVQPSECFLTQTPKDDSQKLGGNIFHLAAWNNRVEFVREAATVLPADILKKLLFQVEGNYNWTPLHADEDDGLTKPWLALNLENRTPLHLALKDDKVNEKCAMEILSMDTQFECCALVDDTGATPLFYALTIGFNLVAETILMSSLSSTSIFRTKDFATPFSYTTNCSENVVKLLFKKCGDWLDKIDDKGFSMLHQWAEKGDAGPCKLLLEGDDVGDARTKIFKECIFGKENKGFDTPLHIAARKKDSELAQILIYGYQQEVSEGEGENRNLVGVECPPWNVTNNQGNTPLHTALSTTSKHEELALNILSIDPSSCKICNNKGESPFFLAVRSGCARAVDEIIKIEEPRFHMLRRNDGTTVVHSLSACPENIGRMILEKYWWIINSRDDQGKTALDYAKQANALWLVSLLTNPSLIQKEEFDWIEACKREESLAVLAFLDSCQDLQRACREENDTPLHHVKLATYKDYLNFLKIPSIAELKNTTDHDGATPLHRALERKNMLLAKTLLLDDGVERTIADHNGRTSMDLLAKLWTNLDQVRNTLSVVAALLATITFAAGFTLPGGIDINGEALLAKQTAFLVFLLADVYAMCTSMLVLFCLIWSMVSEPDMARLLVDRSVFILMQSLYGTLLAFMTGVYTVIAQRSLWAAILVFVMCAIIGISANRTILHGAIAKFVPEANKEKQDQMHLLEEGRADASSNAKNTSRIKA
ncbi:hypothetical protein KSS87_019292 [Heliosperma pusillum]|nr:hypothetical protein KSS87_019292 [Heliosperma pusillum]